MFHIYYQPLLAVKEQIKKTDSFETSIFKELSGYIRGDGNLAIDDVDSVSGHGDRKRRKCAGDTSQA